MLVSNTVLRCRVEILWSLLFTMAYMYNKALFLYTNKYNMPNIKILHCDTKIFYQWKIFGDRTIWPWSTNCSKAPFKHNRSFSINKKPKIIKQYLYMTVLRLIFTQLNRILAEVTKLALFSVIPYLTAMAKYMLNYDIASSIPQC